MKLLKALESGRPFRLKTVAASIAGGPYYTTFEGKVTGEGGQSRGISAADLASDDWELEPKDVKLTRTELERAMAGVVPPVPVETQAEILARLGL